MVSVVSVGSVGSVVSVGERERALVENRTMAPES